MTSKASEVNRRAIVEALVESLGFRRYNVTRDECAVTQDGSLSSTTRCAARLQPLTRFKLSARPNNKDLRSVSATLRHREGG